MAQSEKEKKAIALIESLLGYPLSKSKRFKNYYDEKGKSRLDCPCLGDDDNLLAADDVVYAYRIFPYNSHDKYLEIDPALDVHAVKLVANRVTYYTFEKGEYQQQQKGDFIKYLADCSLKCQCRPACSCVQLAVDAEWMFEGCLPGDLQLVIDDITDYFSDPRRQLKRQTLATHSYEFADTSKPWEQLHNKKILMKYAGPNGTLHNNII